MRVPLDGGLHGDHLYVCMYAFMHAMRVPLDGGLHGDHLYVCMHACMHACMHTCVCVCMHGDHLLVRHPPE